MICEAHLESSSTNVVKVVVGYLSTTNINYECPESSDDIEVKLDY